MGTGEGWVVDDDILYALGLTVACTLPLHLQINEGPDIRRTGAGGGYGCKNYVQCAVRAKPRDG